MNSVHLHLVSTHVPVVGAGFGLCLYLVAMGLKSKEGKLYALGMFVVCALFAFPAYFSGAPALVIAKRASGLRPDIVEQHIEMAQLAAAGLGLLGATALSGLLLFRKDRSIPAWFTGAILALGLTSVVLLGFTSNFGARIRHYEIRYNEGEY